MDCNYHPKYWYTTYYFDAKLCGHKQYRLENIYTKKYIFHMLNNLKFGKNGISI